MAKVTGEGTIVQLEKDKPKSKCRKWQLRVPVGLDPRTGKYNTRTRRYNGTYTEAKKAPRQDTTAPRTSWGAHRQASKYSGAASRSTTRGRPG